MYKIAVMGDWDSIYGFGALGFETFPVTDPRSAEKILRDLAEKQTAVIYVTEALAKQIDRTIASYASRPLPAIILIPGASGNTGEGMLAVKRSVEQAVGSDIIFGDN